MAFRQIVWNPDQLRDMRLVRKMSYPAIGRALGCHHTTAMLKCWALGIEPPPAARAERRREARLPRAPGDRVEEQLRFPRETDEQAAMWRRLLLAARQMRDAQLQQKCA